MKINRLGSKKFWVSTFAALFLTSGFIGLHAFKPENESFGHTYITRAVTNEGGYPAYAGKSEIKGFVYKYADGAEGGFSSEAQEHLIKGVQSNDWFGPRLVEGILFESYIKDANAHCDDDSLAGCASKIRDWKAQSLGELRIALAESKQTDPDSELQNKAQIKARVLLGNALHTIQDFYTHSNFIEQSRGELTFARLTSSAVLLKSDSARDFVGNLCQPRDEAVMDVPITDPLTGVLIGYGPRFTWEKNPGNYQYTGSTTVANYTTGYFDFFATGVGIRASAPDQPIPGPE